MTSQKMVTFTRLHLLFKLKCNRTHVRQCFHARSPCRPNHLQLLYNRKTLRDSAALLHSSKGKFS